MAEKGQKFKTYSLELKKEAIRLHVEEKWTYRQITDHLHIHDADRVRKWMQKYRKQGEFGLLDQRGRREECVDSDRQIKQLQRENKLLKKCLRIWREEERKHAIRSFDR